MKTSKKIRKLKENHAYLENSFKTAIEALLPTHRPENEAQYKVYNELKRIYGFALELNKKLYYVEEECVS